jgi:hypothetical protein
VWTFAFGALLVLFGVDLRRRRAENETSRALLQSFLF